MTVEEARKLVPGDVLIHQNAAKQICFGKVTSVTASFVHINWSPEKKDCGNNPGMPWQIEYPSFWELVTLECRPVPILWDGWEGVS